MFVPMLRYLMVLIPAGALALVASTVVVACGDDSPTTTASEDTTTGGEPGTTTADPDTSSGPGDGTTSDITGVDTTGVDTTEGETGGGACGDGVVDEGEGCDDGNTGDDDGCSSDCAVEEGWTCAVPPIGCTTVCGDGFVVGDEGCDDGNDLDTDGCTNECVAATCGDGIVWAGTEECDDGNNDSLDGCSFECTAEAGIACDDGVPANCFPAAFVASGTAGTAGNLWAIALDGSTTLDLGPLATAVTGMAFHPDGTLYAVSSSQLGSRGSSQLGIIDPEAVTFTPIGSLQDELGTPHDGTPDITFMGTTLLGWTENTDSLTIIDTATATVTVTPTSLESEGTALAYDLVSDEVLLAPASSSGTLFAVDALGTVAVRATLLGGGGDVRGMAVSQATVYGMDFGASELGSLVTFDVSTGAVTELAVLPAANIDALAVFDRDYEEMESTLPVR